MISPFFSHLLTPHIITLFLAITIGRSGSAPAFGIGSSIFEHKTVNTCKEILLFGKFEAVGISFASASLLTTDHLYMTG